MKNRSGQVSVEFMLLVGLVLIIFVPLLILVSMSGIESTERISGERVGAIARVILDESREIYYLGEGSRQTITVDIPRGVRAVQAVTTDSSSSSELVFVFVQSGMSSTISHVSEVPIRIHEDSRLLDDSEIICDPEPLCESSCDCVQFDPETMRSGARNIELRTMRDDDGLYVSMRVLS